MHKTEKKAQHGNQMKKGRSDVAHNANFLKTSLHMNWLYLYHSDDSWNLHVYRPWNPDVIINNFSSVIKSIVKIVGFAGSLKNDKKTYDIAGMRLFGTPESSSSLSLSAPSPSTSRFLILWGVSWAARTPGLARDGLARWLTDASFFSSPSSSFNCHHC